MLGCGTVARVGSLLSVLTAACTSAPAGSSAIVARSALLSGADDREQVFELSATARDVVASSAAALFPSQHVVLSAGPGASLRARSASDELGVCADEAFADEPSAARCSGVLIDDDLVATAGHCLGNDVDAGCRQARVVFGYWYGESGRALELSNDEVFTCRRVVTHETAHGDFAVLQLDRAVRGRLRPVALAEAPARPGARLTFASHGAGLPLKVELRAEVVESSPGEPLFVVATDTFGGSSGGPLYDEQWRWLGLAAKGGRDWSWDDGCARPARAETAGEMHQHALNVVSAVCAQGWPSSRLCGSAARCGDGVCSPSEDACAADCPRARCGDGLCELVERGACSADCNRDDEVPLSWPLSADSYWEAHPKASVSALSARGGCAMSTLREPGQRWAWLAAMWLGCASLLRVARRVRGEP
jgi:hypothetical protein